MILHTHKQEQHQNNKTKANSYEQLKDADIHSDDDDIVDKRTPTDTKLHYFFSELLKKNNNTPSLNTNILHQLQQTDLSNISLELKKPSKIPAEFCL